jgi:ABC-type nitrate/sulfonate/bicarbonate transport system permease component
VSRRVNQRHFDWGPVFRVLGLIVLLAAWEWIGRSGLWGDSFPALSAMLDAYDTPARREILGRALLRTATSAALGLGIGACASLLLVCAGHLLKPLHEGIESFATTIHAIPTIAFGPVLILVAGPESTPVVLSALAAYFPIMVALDSALKFAPRAPHDLAAVLGASTTRAFVRIHFPAAVPGFVDGLRMGAPGAVIGAALGEWFGAPRGLGVLIISSLQNVRIPQLWAAALLCVACSLIAYTALSLLHRWAQRRYT